MMFDKIKEYFKKKELPKKIVNALKPRVIFLDKDNKEIIYKEHLRDEGMLVIEDENGLTKIPTSGLKIKGK